MLTFGKKNTHCWGESLQLNNSFSKAKCIMKLFSGAKVQDLEHVTPNLKHDKPDVAFINIGSNNVSYNNLHIDASILAKNILKIGKKMH